MTSTESQNKALLVLALKGLALTLLFVVMLAALIFSFEDDFSKKRFMSMVFATLGFVRLWLPFWRGLWQSSQGSENSQN